MPDQAPFEKRGHKRSHVLLKAVVKVGDWATDVRIRDMSIQGALVESESPPALGRDVHLVREGLDAACRVTWLDGGRFGVEFHVPLTPEALFAQVGARLRVSAPRGYRWPGVDEEADKGADLHIVHDARTAAGGGAV